MTKIIRTEITIKASPKKIWKILTSFEKFADWNPFIKQISGKLEVGEQLQVVIYPPKGASMKFKPTILSLVEEKEFIWKGMFLLPGLFDGEHRFFLEKDGNNLRFVQEELFTGILSYIMPKTIYEKTEAGFKEMNLALKNKAERR